MTFASSPALRTEIIVACRVLSYFRIVEGFGHVSARVEGSERILITPRRALGLVTEPELVEFDRTAGRLPARVVRPLKRPCTLRCTVGVPT